MLKDIFDLLSLIVDGPEKDEDRELLKRDLFVNSACFDEAVTELFDEASRVNNMRDIYTFIRLCVAVDVTIAYRIDNLDTELAEDPDRDPEDATFDYLNTLRSIDDVFAISDSNYGVAVLDGTADVDRMSTGLTGRLVRIYTDMYSDQNDFLKRLLDLFRQASATNPSTTCAWWQDTLKSIYSNPEPVEEDDESNWYYETDSVTNQEIVEQWYLKLIPILHKLVELTSEIYDETSPVSFISMLVDNFRSVNRDILEDMYERGNQVSYTSPNLDQQIQTPATVEGVVRYLISVLSEE